MTKVAMKYKVGDKVRVKSLDWYNENKDEFDEVHCKGYTFVKSMVKYCDMVLTIKRQTKYGYYVKENSFNWTDEMIEGLVEKEDENNYLTETVVDTVRESNDRYRIILDPRFDIEVDEGEYYAVRRKKEYPKTYEECVSVLGIYNGLPDVEIYNAKPSECTLFESLIRLKRCRDAYWKIAGEEMGLGKHWEPDWTNQESSKYCIAYVESQIKTAERYLINTILSFPTPEMRDAFKENFDPDIEICKEFL